MKTIAIAAVLSVVALGAAQAQPSPCKGLEQAKCAEVAGCRWMPARVEGEKSPTTGKVYQQGAKAHCRKGTPPKGSTAAADRSA